MQTIRFQSLPQPPVHKILCANRNQSDHRGHQAIGQDVSHTGLHLYFSKSTSLLLMSAKDFQNHMNISWEKLKSGRFILEIFHFPSLTYPHWLSCLLSPHSFSPTFPTGELCSKFFKCVTSFHNLMKNSIKNHLLWLMGTLKPKFIPLGSSRTKIPISLSDSRVLIHCSTLPLKWLLG